MDINSLFKLCMTIIGFCRRKNNCKLFLLFAPLFFFLYFLFRVGLTSFEIEFIQEFSRRTAITKLTRMVTIEKEKERQMDRWVDRKRERERERRKERSSSMISSRTFLLEVRSPLIPALLSPSHSRLLVSVYLSFFFILPKS